MNLEESDKFVEQQRQTEQRKKIVLVSIILCGILVALLVVMIIYIQYQDSLKLKVYIDGREITIPAGFFKSQDDTNYVNIKSLGEMLGYTYTKGEYKKYNEDSNSCYIKNNLEVVAMTAEKETLVKYIDVVEGAPELLPEGPYGIAMTVDAQNGDKNTYVLSKTIKSIDGQLYLPLDYVTDVYNIVMDMSTQNRIRIYTLPTLFRTAVQTAARLEYGTISGVYENIRAIPYGLIVVGDNGIFGVIDSNGNQILSVKYEKLQFIQNSKEFFMSAENTVGLLDKEGNTIIKPTDYDSISTLDEIEQLYLVEKDKKYGVLNRKGEIILHVDYRKIGLSSIKDFDFEDQDREIIFDKCIIAETDEGFGLYDITGKELLKPVYEEFGCKSEETSEESVFMIPKSAGIEGLVIKFNGLYAIFDVQKEEIVIPAVYSKIYSKTKGGKTTYYADFAGNPIDLKDILSNLNIDSQATSTNKDVDDEDNDDDTATVVEIDE